MKDLLRTRFAITAVTLVAASLISCASAKEQFLVIGRVSGPDLGTAKNALACVQYRSFDRDLQVCEPVAEVSTFKGGDRAAFEAYKKRADAVKKFQEGLAATGRLSVFTTFDTASSIGTLVSDIRRAADLARETTRNLREIDPGIDISPFSKMSDDWSALAGVFENNIQAQADSDKQQNTLNTQIAEATSRAGAASDAANAANAAAQRAVNALPRSSSGLMLARKSSRRSGSASSSIRKGWTCSSVMNLRSVTGVTCRTNSAWVIPSAKYSFSQSSS